MRVVFAALVASALCASSFVSVLAGQPAREAISVGVIVADSEGLMGINFSVEGMGSGMDVREDTTGTTSASSPDPAQGHDAPDTEGGSQEDRGLFSSGFEPLVVGSEGIEITSTPDLNPWEFVTVEGGSERYAEDFDNDAIEDLYDNGNPSRDKGDDTDEEDKRDNGDEPDEEDKRDNGDEPDDEEEDDHIVGKALIGSLTGFEPFWQGEIATPFGRIAVATATARDGATDTFIYNITNLTYLRDGRGITSVAIPLAGTGTESALTTPIVPQGWEARTEIGSLGGFLLYDIGELPAGESMTLSFALPDLRMGGPSDPSVHERPLLPPGLILGGGAPLTCMTVGREGTDVTTPHGAVRVGIGIEEAANGLRHVYELTNLSYDITAAHLALSVPFPPESTRKRDSQLRPGWTLQAPRETGLMAGFGTFSCPPAGLPAGESIELPLGMITIPQPGSASPPPPPPPSSPPPAK